MTEETLFIPFDFILMLLGLFAALVVLVLVYHFIKTVRRQRLTNARKDHIYRPKA